MNRVKIAMTTMPYSIINRGALYRVLSKKAMPNPFENITVILIRPHIPENVGFVARSMKSLGFTRLTLVDPSFVLNTQSSAHRTASGSQDVLEQARTVRHLEEAIANLHQIVAFSRRTHNFERPQDDLAPWVQTNKERITHHKTALVFGPEDYGLSTKDKQLCKQIVTIPMQAETMSLNLSHAVTIVLYEIARVCQIERPPSPSRPPARHQDVQRVINQLVAMLEPTTYFKEGRKEKQTEVIRHLIQKLEMDEVEYNTMMGMLNAITKDR
jgi:tRNA/rRNA methyltransferase